jgi:uncharacterized glyoxalase superfamily protein PhnB
MIAPVFLVDDVVATANFYRDTFGFHYERFWGDPPSFCMVKRFGGILMLTEKPGAMRPNHLADGQSIDAYLWVDDVDALYAELKANGAKIVRELRDEPYGMRDFDVEDCNGYRLAFGSDGDR